MMLINSSVVPLCFPCTSSFTHRLIFTSDLEQNAPCTAVWSYKIMAPVMERKNFIIGRPSFGLLPVKQAQREFANSAKTPTAAGSLTIAPSIARISTFSMGQWSATKSDIASKEASTRLSSWFEFTELIAMNRRKWLRSFWMSGVIALTLSNLTAKSTKLASFSIK